RIGAPILAPRLDDIGVSEKKNRLGCSRAVIADHQVRFFRIRAPDKNIGVGESGGFESCGRSFGDRRGRTRGESRLNLDEFFIDIVGKLFVGGGRGGLSAQSQGAEKNQKKWSEHPAFFHEQRIGAINSRTLSATRF